MDAALTVQNFTNSEIAAEVASVLSQGSQNYEENLT